MLLPELAPIRQFLSLFSHYLVVTQKEIGQVDHDPMDSLIQDREHVHSFGEVHYKNKVAMYLGIIFMTPP